MVEVTEVLVAQGGRTALVSGGVEMAAAVALLGDFDEFGLFGHVDTPPWVFWYENLQSKRVRSGPLV